MAFESVVLTFLACIAVFYFILNYHRRQSSIKTVNSLPGPKTFPLIGSALTFLQRSPDEILDTLTELVEKYSTPLRLWMGNKLYIIINKPDQIQTILQNSHCLDKSVIYTLFEPVFGKGLLTAPASIWTEQRKMIAPSINTIMLQKFFGIFIEQSIILTDKLEKVGLNGNEVFFLQHITECTLTNAFATMTDVKMEHLLNLMSQFYKTIISFKETLRTRARNIFLYPNFIFNLTATGREQRKTLNFGHSVIDKVIQQQIYVLNELNTKTKSETSHRSLLHILMEGFYKNKLTQKMVHDNIFTMLLTATDTTAITITFVVLMLANYPDIQEKVYKELREIYGTKTPKSAPIKYEDLQHMDYLDRVIKETLRLFPTVPIIGRRLTEDVIIGEVILPKNTNVVMQFMTLHRNEKYWPNPLVFDPDRFLPERIGTSYMYYYMPFSMGPRNCIGMKYAMISMKVILATLIRTFMFKVNESIQIDKIKLNMDITLSTVEPIKVKIEKRNLH
ncbi:unnamed protein product [Lasius platythorax]|uniref:Cytochrome P450 n=1 Tax=Lasius platythorax TaxID=488582 RepID=A0AAV2NE74_9HYME